MSVVARMEGESDRRIRAPDDSMISRFLSADHLFRRRLTPDDWRIMNLSSVTRFPPSPAVTVT